MNMNPETTTMPDELGTSSCSEFTLHDITGRQPNEIVKGEKRAELRAMTLTLWYPDSRFTIIPNVKAARPVGRLLPLVSRVSSRFLRIEGLLCGHRWPWEPGGTKCGGELWVEDWHPKGVRGENRYEVHCRKCQTCDPNGHARQDQLIPSALNYFKAYPANDQIHPR